MDRDDYYDLQEVLTCLFKVIELGLLESPDIYTSSILEKGKLILLPSHMYDTSNYKNYWLGKYCFTQIQCCFSIILNEYPAKEVISCALIKDFMVPNFCSVVKINGVIINPVLKHYVS